ncbi:hypothetical protein [Pedobacter sp. L105]|uniref:hypothetical protein n=1 Tax=Pedobacter sp. L105 TaxID=1641871 RepID=UPI00131DBE13|nr:hypothetical protein [Pedobacter sp. L105]
MEHLPSYISIVFTLSTALIILLIYKASNYSRFLITLITIWLLLQSVVSLSGFYTVTTGSPPRFALLLLPPIFLIATLFFTKKGKVFIDPLDIKMLTLLHVVRIPVELTLYWLFLHKTVPLVMTFEGRNFDIFCGITAPFVYYFGYVKNSLQRGVLIGWNILCLLLLGNIVITALLSAPFSFQQFGFDQPSIALFYFPFIWLPSCIVPIALFAHLATLRKLLKKDDFNLG